VTSAERSSQRRLAKNLSLGLAAILALLLLYYSLQGIQWSEVGHIVAGAALGRLGFAAAIATLTLLLRALRWRVLLTAAGPVPASSAFWATAAGYFGNNFLPARAGELIRTLIISSQTGLDNAYVLATALSERAADAVALVITSAAVLLIVPSPSGWLADAARPFTVLAAAVIVGIAVLPLAGPFAIKTIERAPVPDALRPKLVNAAEQALRGIQAFHSVRRLSAFVGLTAVIWCLDGVGTVIGAAALGLHVSMPVALLLLAGLGLGSALPSTPGYVGIYQFVAVSVLTPFGLTKTDAIAYILVAQALLYVVMGFWGALGLWRYRSARRAM
jgi:uncharacterized protein (TIRG00374 family)